MDVSDSEDSVAKADISNNYEDEQSEQNGLFSNNKTKSEVSETPTIETKGVTFKSVQKPAQPSKKDPSFSFDALQPLLSDSEKAKVENCLELSEHLDIASNTKNDQKCTPQRPGTSSVESRGPGVSGPPPYWEKSNRNNAPNGASSAALSDNCDLPFPNDQCDLQGKKRSPRSSVPSGTSTTTNLKDDTVSPASPDIERGEAALSISPKVNEIPNTNIAVAFLVTLCFNLPLGALAIYFSLMAAKAYRDGQSKKGASRARTSMLISLFGIVITVLIVMVTVLYIAVKGQGKSKKRSAIDISL